MTIPRWIPLIVVFNLLLLQGCEAESIAETPSATTSLEPYQSATTTLTKAPKADGTIEDNSDLFPPPTPFLHRVQENDSLLSIAIRYGVALDELLAANPGIDPRFLSIGHLLRIPGPDGQPTDSILPTSTPLPLLVSMGRCFQTAEGVWWCLAEVENTTETAIEGLTAKARLINADNELIKSALAFAPLNRLPPGERLPLLTSLETVKEDAVHASFSLLSAVESSDEGSRYLEPIIEIKSQETLMDGEQWRVVGQLTLDQEQEEGEFRISLLAMGFDASDRIVGYRKWEPEPSAPQPWDFDIQVFTLGPLIERVDLMAEATLLSE